MQLRKNYAYSHIHTYLHWFSDVARSVIATRQLISRGIRFFFVTFAHAPFSDAKCINFLTYGRERERDEIEWEQILLLPRVYLRLYTARCLPRISVCVSA